MDLSLLKYLVSPVSRKQLVQAGEDFLKEIDGDISYPFIEGIPVFLPNNTVADWFNEGLEVLFWTRLNELLPSPPDLPWEEWFIRIKGIIDNDGAEGIRHAIRQYAESDVTERLSNPICAMILQESSQCKAVSSKAVEDYLALSTLEAGKYRAQQVREVVNLWAIHRQDYGALVNESGGTLCVEFGTGAGFGTCSVLEQGLTFDRFISLDIDFACVGNALGLARVFGVEERVHPMVASYWFLPLQEGSVDVVCSHYGIDESREVGRTLSEIARILKPGGRFVNVSRTDPTLRLSQFIGNLCFDKDELIDLVYQANLYPGPERFIEIAKINGLVLEDMKVFTPESHERALFCFRKR